MLEIDNSFDARKQQDDFLKIRKIEKKKETRKEKHEQQMSVFADNTAAERKYATERN